MVYGHFMLLTLLFMLTSHGHNENIKPTTLIHILKSNSEKTYSSNYPIYLKNYNRKVRIFLGMENASKVTRNIFSHLL
jgi:hypothetical protein